MPNFVAYKPPKSVNTEKQIPQVTDSIFPKFNSNTNIGFISHTFGVGNVDILNVPEGFLKGILVSVYVQVHTAGNLSFKINLIENSNILTLYYEEFPDTMILVANYFQYQKFSKTFFIPLEILTRSAKLYVYSDNLSPATGVIMNITVNPIVTR